jgi:glutamine amidotransferase
MIRIVDYGMGNLRSVQKAFERNGHSAEICSDPDQLADCEKLVLPGVGAFRDAIGVLRDKGFVDVIRHHVDSDRPFLGICLGLQLLFDVSYEDGEWPGLGILKGSVERFENRPGMKVPHMGWNTLTAHHSPALLKDIPADASFYFVHSYYVVPTGDDVTGATTEYGRNFTSMVARGNLFATQFHPEKSQRVGLALLKNFAEL